MNTAYQIERLKSENLILHNTVKERTAQLEEKSRELQVEGALERIRAEAVAMQKSSDLLDIVVTMRNEFTQLGHEAHYFWYMMWHEETYEKAMTSGDGKKIGFVMKLPRHIHGDIPLLANWERSETPTVVYAMDTDEAIDYVGKMVSLGDFQNIDPQAPSNDDIRHIGGLTFIMARTSHGEIGFSLPGIVKNPPKEDLEILVRFAEAFDLAHRRFLDLQKSEKQAREVQIELALEKVRSRTMAMQHSDELPQAANQLFLEIQALGVPAASAGYCIWEKEDKKSATAYVSSVGQLQKPFSLPTKGVGYNFLDPMKNGEKFHVDEIRGQKENIKHYAFMRTLPVFGEVLDELFKAGFQIPEFQVFQIVYFSKGYLMFITKEHVPDAHDIFKRCAQVFELTYTRFLDLQKAEAQARENQIELALEKVRSRTMAMDKSDELSEAAELLYSEFFKLGVTPFSIGYVINDEDAKQWKIWMTDANDDKFKDFWTLPFDADGHLKNRYDSWKSKDAFHVSLLEGEENKKHHDVIAQYAPWKEDSLKDLPHRLVLNSAHFLHGHLLIVTGDLLSDDEEKLLCRFSKVFEQTYTRFLDLQKAEAQAREAQIEAALEKVRSRSLAVNKIDEFNDVVKVVFERLDGLTIPASSVTIMIPKSDSEHWDVFGSSGSDSGIIALKFELPYFPTPMMDDLHPFRNKAKPGYFTKIYTEEEKNHYYEYAFENTALKNLPDDVKQLVWQSKSYAISAAHANHSIIVVNDFEGKVLDDNQAEILQRFSKVFEQAYIRFLDLQKAEAQARESQIQLSLERVRAKAMAMHDSNELDEVLSVLCEQFDVLGIFPMSTHMTVFDFENNTFTFRETGKFGNRSLGEQTVALDAMDTWKETVDKWKADEATAVNRLHFPKETLPEVWAVFHESFASMPEESRIAPEDYPDGIYHTAGKHPFGYIGMNQTRLATQEEEQMVIKFANEFGRAYQRFLDLQKAEAQARESQIEAAVERVRAEAMAMHTSDDFGKVNRVLWDQVNSLDVGGFAGAGIVLFDQDGYVTWWDFSSPGNIGKHEGRITRYEYDKYPLLGKEIWDAYLENKPYYVLEYDLPKIKNAVKEWEQINPAIADEFKTAINSGQLNYQWGACGRITNGFLTFDFLKSPDDDGKHILIKMANAFELAYQRFLDLQKAEAQAREARIEAALEKVRSRSLSMDKPEELQEVVIVVAEKMQELGVTLDANGVIICTYFPDNKDVVHWMCSNDYKHVGRYLLNYFDHPIFNAAWESRINGDEYFSESFTIEEKNTFFEYAFAETDYKHFPDEFKEWIFKNDQHALSFAWAANSAILIPSHTGVLPTDEDAEIMKRFARVFEQAYVRFKDLQVKEQQATELLAEKQRLEATLSDLQATQKQLIQSEKMASLGELTAGIAHEIQNPLNFVNNFSEVSNELIDEMNEEIEKGDLEEAKFIAKDIKQNLEKINHHGKRADAIVKGMLQHSRKSTAEKEPTDINKLSDEYLRLAYHGLRAKDKSFNATLKTDFDECIGLVNVIPQDIGRVMLNLITNAFYATNERRKLGKNNYEPMVEVSTSIHPLTPASGGKLDGLSASGGKLHTDIQSNAKADFKSDAMNDSSSDAKGMRLSPAGGGRGVDKGHILISVSDNGTGIPKHVIDKIFQPFFTTKPTGEGTGLGLSMSYDIIKAHGGEIKINSKINEGTEFKILLPINTEPELVSE